MQRTQYVLGGILLLQVLLIAAIRGPLSDGPAAGEARPLVPGLELSSAARLELLGSEQSRKVTLIKSGEGWRVEQADGFPASQSKVDRLLEDLGALTVRRPVVRSDRYHEAFKVTDANHEARIRLWKEQSDGPDLDLILGSSSNYRATHARLSDEDAVYEIPLASYDVQPNAKAWIESELVGVDVERVVGLVLHNAHGKIELERRDGRWVEASNTSPVAEPGADAPPAEDASLPGLDQDKVVELVRAAASLRVAEPAGRTESHPERFAKPAATLVLRLEGGDEVTLTVGDEAEDGDSGRRYVKRDGFEFAATVWDSSVSRWIDETIAGLTAS